MIQAQSNPVEQRRLAALRRYDVLDTLPDQALDDLTALAASICGAPIAMISLIDENRQWFKSKVGLDLAETPRDISFCGHAMQQRDLFIVPDATHDDRFAHNPLVTGDPKICFYAGAPLVSPDDHALGALCVIDHVPRTLNPAQEKALRVLSRQVMLYLELRRQMRDLAQSEERLRAATDDVTTAKTASHRLSLIVEGSDDAIIGKDLNSIITSWNKGAEKIFGYTAGEMLGTSILRLIPEDRWDEEAQILAKIGRGENVDHFETQRQTRDGRLIDVSVTASPIRDATGKVIGASKVAHDITERKLSEKALHRERDFVSAVVDTVGSLVVVIDREAKIIRFNRACEQLTGYSFEEVKGQNLIDLLIMPEERATTTAEFHNLCAGQFPNTFENHWVTRQGDPRVIVWSNTALLDANGNVEYVIGTGTDVTDRKRSEEALRESRATLDSALASMSDAVFITDGNGRFIEFNDAFVSLHRFSNRDECFKVFSEYADFLEVFLPNGELAPLDMWAVPRALRGETAANAEFTMRRKDTGETWAGTYSFSPIRNHEGVIVGTVTVGRDITERKRDAEKIAEQAALLDKARDAILVRDLEGNILFWNNGAERVYGWSREEAVGHNVLELFYSTPGKFEEVNAQTIRQGEWQGELQHLTKDKRELTIEARWTLIRDNEGKPKSILAINSDITEKKKIEAQFMRAQRMESIGTLAGGVAHDLNNILAPIMMSIDILKAISTEPQAITILETIEVSAKRGADIVRQVLSFSRGLEGQRIEVHPKHLVKDLQNIIQDTFPKDIRLQFSVPNDTWTILGDPTQVHQILLNLCVNARDAMPNGGSLAVRAENCELDEQYAAMNIQAKPGRYVLISVTDSGTGMPPGVIDKIFEPFFTTKPLNKGTGLGLSTVMAIVKSHDGIVNVYSEPGKGTTFQIYLPATETTTTPHQEKAQAANLPRGHGETILVVDDEASILTITCQTLQAFGYRVLTAANGAAAVAAYAKQPGEIAVVLTDMMMPIMDGPATIHALLQINPQVKIIAASGLTTNGHEAQVASAGITHFLTKPYTAATLLKSLRALLDEA